MEVERIASEAYFVLKVLLLLCLVLLLNESSLTSLDY